MPQESYLRVGDDGEVKLPQEWRLKEQDKPPKISLDLGTHVHQMIKFLSNKKVLSVFGVERSNGHFKSLKDTVHSIAQLEGGTICQIWFGKLFRKTKRF